MKHRLTNFNPSCIKTITFDNGKEFAYHYKIAKDLRKVSIERIKEVEKLLNYRPIRKFNYLNPIEKLKNECVALMS